MCICNRVGTGLPGGAVHAGTIPHCVWGLLQGVHRYYRVYTAPLHTSGHTQDVGGSFSQMLEYEWNQDKNHSEEEDTHGNQ